MKYTPEDNQVALLCLTVIAIVGIVMNVEGIKDILLASVSAIGGWMYRGEAKKT